MGRARIAEGVSKQNSHPLSHSKQSLPHVHTIRLDHYACTDTAKYIFVLVQIGFKTGIFHFLFAKLFII